MEIKLSANQGAQFIKLFKSLGLDTVPVDDTNEAVAPEMMMLSVAEMEQMVIAGKPMVIALPKSVEAKVAKAVKEFGEAKDWYYDFNKNMREFLGEDDAPLFLSILAVFSANQNLAENFRTATNAYHALRDDVNNKPEILKRLFSKIQINEKHLKQQVISLIESDPEIANLALAKNVVFKTMPTHLNNALRVWNFYIENNFRFPVKALMKVMASTLDSTGRLPHNKGKPEMTMIGAQKIFNFTMNLIDPDYIIDMYDWAPTTIDTHMVAFFYPETHEASVDAVTGTSKTGATKRKGVLADYRQYAYIARNVQTFAKKFNMKPHQLQAVLWMASISERRRTTPNKDFSATLSKTADKFKKSAEAAAERAESMVNKEADDVIAAMKKRAGEFKIMKKFIENIQSRLK